MIEFSDIPEDAQRPKLQRNRLTRAGYAALDEAIIAAVEQDRPLTVRAAYYRVLSAGVVTKSDRSYDQVQGRLVKLRETGRVSYTDIIDAVQGHRPPTDRLRHVAQIGFITRGWAYANRGEAVPEGAIRVVLEAPSGETWTFGPDDAAASVTGTAEQFCQVVTQRRHVDDTDLVVIGGIAADWLAKAQAYAGPPTTGPAPRGRN